MPKVLIGFLVAALFAAAPGWSSDAGHALRVRISSDPRSFDWQLARGAAATWVASNLMEGLVQIDAKSGKALPSLATKWTTSPDLKTWTFKLRKGVLWSDGVPLKAQDFITSWERLLAPTTYSASAAFLFDVINAQEFHEGKIDFGRVGLKALDDATIEVKLKTPMADWFWYPSLVSLFPVRVDLIKKDPLNWASPGRLVTLGPFTLEKYEPDRRIVVVRNSKYYGKHGNLVEIDFEIVKSDEDAVTLFDGGRLDLLPSLSQAAAAKNKHRPEFISWSDMKLVYLLLNAKLAPTSDVHVRRAIAMALDRSRITAQLGDECAPSSSPIPASLEGADIKVAPRFDPVAAKKELAAAVSAVASQPLTLLAQSVSDTTALAKLVGEQLQTHLGLTVKPELKSPKDYYSLMNNRSAYAINLAQWTCDFPDPDDYLLIFLSTTQQTYGTWINDEYDRAVIDARGKSSARERRGLYTRALQILLAEDAIAVPLCHGRINGLISKRVSGYRPGPMTWWIYRDVSVR